MKTEFKGTQGELEASGLFIKPIGKHPIGQAFVIDFKHDVGGRSIPDVQGAAYAKLWAASPDLLEALNNLLERYTELINCGDCGNWNPETEDEVINARIAIKKALNLA